MPISDVGEDRGFIVAYGPTGRETGRMGIMGRSVLAVAGDFFVVSQGAWFVTYDERCKEIRRMGSNGRVVKGAAGKTFTVIEGKWLVNYDQQCKEQGRRAG